MGDIFLKLLNRSITAGWFLLAVLCIRLIFRKAPKWMHCLLWGMAAVRLICPFFVESGFSILPSTEPIKTSTVVDGEVRNDIPSIDSRLTIVENTINPLLTESFSYRESESAAPLQIVTYAVGVAWACGTVLLIVYAMGSMIRLNRLVREAVCVKDPIYLCDAVRSPFILGIVRPRIYLPSALCEKEIGYIIAHESAHLKRKDHWWKLLGYFLLCVYWFHPLCWVSYAMFCKDLELACDEKVARGLTFHEKKEYARVLLSCTRQRSLLMVCPLAFGEVGVRERVKSVLNYKKPTLWMMIAAAAVFAVSALCFLTDPPDQDAFLQADQAEAENASSQGENGDSRPLERMPVEKTSTQKGSPEPERGILPQTKETAAEGDIIQDVVLYERPEADKVCIEIQPCVIRRHLFYYYIPPQEDQKWLSGQIEALDLQGGPLNKRWEGYKETGWKILYHDIIMTGLEGGFLYYTYYDEEKGMMESLIEAPKLCDYIRILLTEEAGYQNYDVSEIKDIVSAKLEVNAIFTDWQPYSQTITDAETLQKFEEWFKNAKYIFGGADCGNQCACLELTLADGDVVKLSMATDSCPNFSINGVAYDYHPVPNWDNSEFFRCFDEIPR